MKALVIGSKFGRFHAMRLIEQESIEHVRLTGRNVEKVKQIISGLPYENLHASQISSPDQAKELAKRLKPDIVCVCTPDGTHVDYINAVRKNTGIIFSEKPLLPAIQSPHKVKRSARDKLYMHLPIYTALAAKKNWDINGNLDVTWILKSPDRTDVIDNIAPHIWSILRSLGINDSIQEASLEDRVVTIKGPKFSARLGYGQEAQTQMQLGENHYRFAFPGGNTWMYEDITEVQNLGNPLEISLLEVLRKDYNINYSEAVDCHAFQVNATKALEISYNEIA